MKKKIKDRHLDIPAEANRDKHVNFVALERNEKDPSTEKSMSKYAPSDANERNQNSESRIEK
jgi:hypothetical protein